MAARRDVGASPEPTTSHLACSLSLAVLVTRTQTFQVQLRLEVRVLPTRTPPGGNRISDSECSESLPVSQQSSRPAAPARRPGWRFMPDTI